MADVEIAYKGATIATMDDSGTKTLLTNSTWCEDDITIQYTKSGGGGTSNYTITVSLTNPISPSDFSYCEIYEAENPDFEESMMTTPLATLSSPTGSATVSIPSTSYGIIIYPNGNWGATYNVNHVTCTGKIAFIRQDAIFVAPSLYLVGSDGTVTINGIDYGD